MNSNDWEAKTAVILFYVIAFILLLMATNAFAERRFFIERPSLGLGLSYKFEEDERTGPDITTMETTETYTEKLEIETEGWFYHPALLTYTLRLSPEWEQIVQESNESEKRTSRTFLQGYFTEFTFLQFKPYTLRLFANRQTSTLESAFAQRAKTDSDTYGGALMLKYRALPTILTYNHLKSAQSGFFTSDEDRDEFRMDMRHNSEKSGDTVLNASYIDSAKTTQGIPATTEAMSAFLNNSYNVTKDKKMLLNSSLNYREILSNFIKNTGYSLSESLLWRHTRNLSTNYTIHYDKNEDAEFSAEKRSAGFNLTHLLYENLTTSINIDGSSSEFTGGSEDFYGGGVNFNYNRKIPWGTLNINTGYDYRLVNRDITQNFLDIRDESHFLTDGVIALLANEHVVIDSIAITDATGTIVYIKDVDYRIEEIDFSVRISRTTFGGIANGQEVLVDYQYLSNPAFDYSTFGQSYGINLNLWSVWRVFYRFNRSEQKFISGTPPDTLTDDSIHTAGTELNWKWSATRLELEDRQTTNIPTRKWQAEETITARYGRSIFLSLSGHYGVLKFKETDEDEKFYGVNSNIQLITSRQSRLTFQGFEDRTSGPAKDITNSGFLSNFEWFYGIWRAGISYKFLNERDEIFNETRRNHYVLFEVKRMLF